MPFVLAVIVMLGMSPVVHGATQIQEMWGTYGGNGFLTWDVKETTAYGPAQKRSDSERSRLLWGKPLLLSEIERQDLDKVWKIDVRKKRYTETSISAAREKAKQEAEKARQAWEKEEKKDAGSQPTEEPTVRIRSAKTKTTGPGPAETINGFSCRPYQVMTVIEFESLPEKKLIGHQTLYTKVWTTDSALLAQYRQAELAYWKASVAGDLTPPEKAQLVAVIQAQLKKAQSDPSQNPWMAFAAATENIKGQAIRTIGGYIIVDAENPPAKTKKTEPQDAALIESGDFSGSVGGALGGIASRWATKKAEKKVSEKVDRKLAEHPAWVDEINQALQPGETLGWGWMNEIQSVTSVDSKDFFEVPAGYKKVAM